MKKIGSACLVAGLVASGVAWGDDDHRRRHGDDDVHERPAGTDIERPDVDDVLGGNGGSHRQTSRRTHKRSLHLFPPL